MSTHRLHWQRTASIALAVALVAQLDCGLVEACSFCDGPPRQLDVTELYSAISDVDGASHVITADNFASCLQFNQVSTWDQGLSWDAPRRLDANPSLPCGEAFVGFASDSNSHAYAAWLASNGTGPRQLVIKVSSDRGRNWPGDVVTVAASDAVVPNLVSTVIADASGQVWIFWLQGPTNASVRLWMSRSVDFGVNWTSPERIDTSAAAEIPYFVVTRTASGRFYLIYQAGDWVVGSRLYFSRSDDGGTTWSVASLIDDLPGPVFLSAGGILPFDLDRLLVFWIDTRNGRYDLYSRRSDDGGSSWPLAPVRVDEGDAPGQADSSGVRLVRSGPAGEVLMTWQDRRDGYSRLYSNISLDGGLTWGLVPGAPATPVSAEAADSVINQVALSAHLDLSRVTLYWRDSGRDWVARCGRPTCPALYAARTCDGGRSWEADRMVLDVPLNGLKVATFPDGADAPVWELPSTHVDALRVDGPTQVVLSGPTPYCLGADPLLTAMALTAGCPGGYQLQWYVDGNPVPGATQPTWQPSLAAGTHQLEVRASCLLNPACVPDAIPVTLEARAPSPPPDIGNHLRAVRVGSTDAALSWASAPTVAGAHFHVRRSFAKATTWSMAGPDPGLTVAAFRDAPPIAQKLVLYDVRQADLCETESAN